MRRGRDDRSCCPSRSDHLSGLSHKFLDIAIVSVEFASGVVLGEGPVNRFAIEITRVSPRQHGPL